MEFDPDRYSRHRLVEWFDQGKIATVRALVVGAGAIGNEVLKNLALLGVRQLSIVDLDQIEIHNLTRSVLFRECDVGRSKAEVAAMRVNELLPEAAVTVIEGPLESTLRPSLLAKYDVVFSCLDNFEARLSLNEMCTLAGVNVVSGAIDARYASVELYPFHEDGQHACYACNLPSGAYQRVAQRYSCGWLRRIGLVEKKVPTTIITSSLVASMMVSWGLRFGHVDGDPDQASKRLLTDTFSGLGSNIKLPLNEACPACSQLQNQIEILPWSEPLNFPTQAVSGTLMARAPTEIVFSASCSACGFDATGSVRPGSKLRGYSTEARVCPSCHAETVVIDARDSATLGEFAALRNGRAPEVPYVLIDIGTTTFCLEVEHE